MAQPLRKRGFAAMDPAKAKALSSLGGKAAHRNGRAHEFTVEEARAAGIKGGNAKAAAALTRRNWTPEQRAAYSANLSRALLAAWARRKGARG